MHSQGPTISQAAVSDVLPGPRQDLGHRVVYTIESNAPHTGSAADSAEHVLDRQRRALSEAELMRAKARAPRQQWPHDESDHRARHASRVRYRALDVRVGDDNALLEMLLHAAKIGHSKPARSFAALQATHEASQFGASHRSSEVRLASPAQRPGGYDQLSLGRSTCAVHANSGGNPSPCRGNA